MRFIVSGENIFADNPELSMFQHLRELTSSQLKWVALVYDYESPISQMPLPVRQIKAGHLANLAFDENGEPTGVLKDAIAGKHEKIGNAIREYREIQFDEDKETLIAYNEQLKEFREFMRKKDKKAGEVRLALQLQKEMPTLLRMRREIANIVGLRAEDDMDMEALDDMSTIERIIFEEEKLKDEERQ